MGVRRSAMCSSLGGVMLAMACGSEPQVDTPGDAPASTPVEVTPVSSPAGPAPGGVASEVDAAVRGVEDTRPEDARSLQPMPGWRLKDLTAERDGDSIEVTAQIAVDAADGKKHQVVARATCAREGRAFTESSALALDEGGGMSFAPPPESGDLLRTNTMIYNLPGGPCEIELRTIPFERGPMRSLGQPMCMAADGDRPGRCSGVVRRSAGTLEAVSVEAFELTETGDASFIVTPRERMHSRERIGIRARCVEEPFVRPYIAWGPMRWHHIEPGESRRVEVRLFKDYEVDDCEVAVQRTQFDVATSTATEVEPLLVSCFRAGALTPGRCPVEMWGRRTSAPADGVVETLGVTLAGSRGYSNDYHVQGVAEFVARSPLSIGDALEVELECAPGGVAFGGDAWRIGYTFQQLHEMSADELFEYGGYTAFKRKPKRCVVTARLIHATASSTVSTELGRFCGGPDGPMTPCKP